MDLRGHRHVRGHLLTNSDARRYREGAPRVAGFARNLPPHRSITVTQEALQHTAGSVQGGMRAVRPWPNCPHPPLHNYSLMVESVVSRGKSNFLSVCYNSCWWVIDKHWMVRQISRYLDYGSQFALPVPGFARCGVSTQRESRNVHRYSTGETRCQTVVSSAPLSWRVP